MHFPWGGTPARVLQFPGESRRVRRRGTSREKPQVMEQPKDQRPSWEGELFRLLVENTSDYAVFAIDLEGRVLTWNPGAERVLGYAEAEILGQSSFVTFTPEDRAARVPEHELQTALREGRAGDDR